MSSQCSGWVSSLKGQDLTFTGRVYMDGAWNVRAECERSARREGATTSGDFRASTTLVVWGELAAQVVAAPDAGMSRKLLAAAAARADRRHVHTLSSDGFADLLAGKPARCLRLARRRGHVVSPGFARLSLFGTELVVARAPSRAGTSLRIDLDKLDQGTRAHQETVRALQQFLGARGAKAMAPAASAPRFDIGWETPDAPWIAEVKSVSQSTESQQVRLGLGQVLEYRGRLNPRHGHVRAALVLSSQPRDRAWSEICDAVGVVLTWAPGFPRLLPR